MIAAPFLRSLMIRVQEFVVKVAPWMPKWEGGCTTAQRASVARLFLATMGGDWSGTLAYEISGPSEIVGCL